MSRGSRFRQTQKGEGRRVVDRVSRGGYKAEGATKVVVLNGSLKGSDEQSNTDIIVDMVLGYMAEFGDVGSQVIRLADANIPVGLTSDEGPDDDWPGIVEQILAADVLIWASPVWWGGRSSLIQRAIERMDAIDEEYLASGENVIYGKVAGVCVTGAEDGAMNVIGTIMMVSTFMGFACPPECAAYWVGEVGLGEDMAQESIPASQATQDMAAKMARSLLHYSTLARDYPMPSVVGKSIQKAKSNFSTNQAVEVLNIDNATADKILDRIHDGGSADDVLYDISSTIGGQGVEAWLGEGQHSAGDPLVALYVEMGGAYNGTVIYDQESGNYILTDIGSYREDRIRDGLDSPSGKSLPGGNVGGTVGVTPDGDESMNEPLGALALENTREERG